MKLYPILYILRNSFSTLFLSFFIILSLYLSISVLEDHLRLCLLFGISHFVKREKKMGRQPCCDKVGLKKGPWTAEEDRKLINFILTNGQCCWRAVPKLAGLALFLLACLFFILFESSMITVGRKTL